MENVMTRDDFEKMGDLHKSYEKRTESYLLPGVPFVVRLDGRSFHNFTKGLQRPFDSNFSHCMIETTADLVKEFHADVGYTQSDEITLLFENNSKASEMLFGGRVQKIVSIFAARASVKFNAVKDVCLESKRGNLALMDARVFQYPTKEMAAETLLWRETDATRNSLTMLAHHYYPHKELQGKGFKAKHDMLHAKGVNWNDCDDHFKRGTYLKRTLVWRDLTDAEKSNIPEKYRPVGPVQSHEVLRFNWQASKFDNFAQVVFEKF